MKNNFSTKLKELRKVHNLSQKKLAELLSLSRESISYYENRAKNPTLELMHKVANFFDISVTEFLDDEKGLKLRDYKEKIENLSLNKQKEIFKILDLALQNVYSSEKEVQIICPLTGEKATAYSLENNLNTRVYPVKSPAYEIRKKFSFKIKFL